MPPSSDDGVVTLLSQLVPRLFKRLHNRRYTVASGHEGSCETISDLRVGFEYKNIESAGRLSVEHSVALLTVAAYRRERYSESSEFRIRSAYLARFPVL